MLDREKYSALYDKHFEALDGARKYLRNTLESTLIELLNTDIFRVRITEARVKDKESLLEKLLSDKTDPQEAFTKRGKVRDLIGARIVCYNLKDIDRIIETIQESSDCFDVIRASQGKEKRWVEKAHPEFGYRGHHIDVLFTHKRRRWQAEIQIRTLLQDTWASFMHQDVYKGPVLQVVKQHLTDITGSVSNLLYTIDEMAQSLRDHVEQNPISADVKIKTVTALTQNMNSFLEFYNVNDYPPSYKSVKRVDRYYINGTDVRYRHQINAEVNKSAPFEFLLGGDSGYENAKNIAVRNIDAGKSKSVKFKLEPLAETLVKLRLKPNRPKKFHNYEVECQWNYVFEKQVDYIFSPWARYYGRAAIDYQLEIYSDKKNLTPPKIYRLDLKDASAIQDIFQKFGGPNDIGEEMDYDAAKQAYSASFEDLQDIILCLMYFDQ